MAQKEITIGIFRYVLNKKNKTAVVRGVVGLHKTVTDIVITDSIESEDGYYTITTIGTNAFSCLEHIKKIILPNSLTTIGTFAFYNCKALEEINIPDSVTSIGDGAFFGCVSLKEVHIPQLKEIRNTTFAYCKSIERVVIPDSVKKIGVNAFWGCENLKNVEVSDGIKSIGSFAFPVKIMADLNKKFDRNIVQLT